MVGGLWFGVLDDVLMVRGCPGVFVVGEMLDWEVLIGGYFLIGCLVMGCWVGLLVVKWF